MIEDDLGVQVLKLSFHS